MHIVRRFSPAVAHSLAGFVLLNCIVRGCEEEKTNLVVPFSPSFCVTRRRRCTRDLCAVCRFHGRPFFPFVPYWDRPLRSWWVLRLRETVPRCPTRMSCFGIAPPGAPFFHSFFYFIFDDRRTYAEQPLARWRIRCFQLRSMLQRPCLAVGLPIGSTAEIGRLVSSHGVKRLCSKYASKITRVS